MTEHDLILPKYNTEPISRGQALRTFGGVIAGLFLLTPRTAAGECVTDPCDDPQVATTPDCTLEVAVRFLTYAVDDKGKIIGVIPGRKVDFELSENPNFQKSSDVLLSGRTESGYTTDNYQANGYTKEAINPTTGKPFEFPRSTPDGRVSYRYETDQLGRHLLIISLNGETGFTVYDFDKRSKEYKDLHGVGIRGFRNDSNWKRHVNAQNIIERLTAKLVYCTPCFEGNRLRGEDEIRTLAFLQKASTYNGTDIITDFDKRGIPTNPSEYQSREFN